MLIFMLKNAFDLLTFWTKSSFFNLLKFFNHVADVEPAGSQRYSSQRQLRLGLVLLVRSLPIFLENRPKDFSNFLHECSLL